MEVAHFAQESTDMPNFGAMSVQVICSSDSAKGKLEWRQSLELDAPAGGIGVTFDLVGQAIGDAWVSILRREFTVERVVIGTLAEDGKPYNPETFAVVPVGLRGTRGAATSEVGNVLPLSTVLHVQKVVSTGRLGAMLIRGMLSEADISSDANGGVFLTNPSGIQTEIDGMFSAIVAGLAGAATVSLISGAGLVLNSREVTGLRVKGVSSKGIRNNRKPAPVAAAAREARSLLSDGGITVDELPRFIELVRTVFAFAGEALPALPLLGDETSVNQSELT